MKYIYTLILYVAFSSLYIAFIYSEGRAVWTESTSTVLSTSAALSIFLFIIIIGAFYTAQKHAVITPFGYAFSSFAPLSIIGFSGLTFSFLVRIFSGDFWPLIALGTLSAFCAGTLVLRKFA